MALLLLLLFVADEGGWCDWLSFCVWLAAAVAERTALPDLRRHLVNTFCLRMRFTMPNSSSASWLLSLQIWSITALSMLQFVAFLTTAATSTFDAGNSSCSHAATLAGLISAFKHFDSPARHSFSRRIVCSIPSSISDSWSSSSTSSSKVSPSMPIETTLVAGVLEKSVGR